MGTHNYIPRLSSCWRETWPCCPGICVTVGSLSERLALPSSSLLPGGAPFGEEGALTSSPALLGPAVLLQDPSWAVLSVSRKEEFLQKLFYSDHSFQYPRCCQKQKQNMVTLHSWNPWRGFFFFSANILGVHTEGGSC